MTSNPYDAPDEKADSPQPTNGHGSRVTSFFFYSLSGLGIVGVLIALILPSIRNAGPAIHRIQCRNNLKLIGLALHNYESTYHALPPAHTVDAHGRPLHSWRTLILPFLDQQRLYDSIDLSKPWNDPANREASRTVVPSFQCPSSNLPPDQRNQTTYLAVVGPDNCFLPSEPRPLSEITDGTSATLMVIEVSPDQAVPWMSPVDADESMVLKLGQETRLPHQGCMHAALVDGSVSVFSPEHFSVAKWKALMTISGNDSDDLEF